MRRACFLGYEQARQERPCARKAAKLLVFSCIFHKFRGIGKGRGLSSATVGDFVRVRDGKMADFWDATILAIATNHMTIQYEGSIERIKRGGCKRAAASLPRPQEPHRLQ
jgi:hypothetical protein